MHWQNKLTIFKRKYRDKCRLIFLWFSLILFGGFNFVANQNLCINNPLIGVTDHLIVVKNNTVIFDYLEQAEVKGPVQIRVIKKPRFGEVVLNEDETFEYTPSLNLCDEADEFTYHLEGEDKTFEVVVSIEILCETLTFFSGIAETEKEKKLVNFKILGVENFPNNSLHIFDDQGNEIYATDNYQNNWNGHVDSTEHLVRDLLYFYVFNDGEGNYHSGYLTKY